jgi:iron(III) transport system substrate-binding protein
MGSSNWLRGLAVILVLAGVTMVLVYPGSSEAAQANPKLAEMVKKAAQEGEIVYQGPDPATGLPTDQMLRDMETITEKHFGVKIRVKIDNALSFPASTAKVLTEIKAGAPPSFDLMYQTVVSAAPLYKEKAIERFPWTEMFSHIKSDDLEYRGLAIISQTNFVLPAYNTNLVKAQDVPKSWNDILAPKWKGKLGILIYPDPWMILAQPNAWGEEKAFGYLKKLMDLNPKLGRFPEVHERVVSGETPLAWGQHRERALHAKQGSGAPVDVADQVDPSLLWINILFVPKGARHPNAAALTAAAMLTGEGQAHQQKFQATTSMFSPGTPAAKFAANRKVLNPDIDFVVEKGGQVAKRVRSIMVAK